MSTPEVVFCTSAEVSTLVPSSRKTPLEECLWGGVVGQTVVVQVGIGIIGGVFRIVGMEDGEPWMIVANEISRSVDIVFVP